MKEESLCETYYQQGCKALENKNYISAKAFFMELINSSELSPELAQTISYHLAEIYKATEQHLEAVVWFTKAILLGSKKAAEEFLDNAFLPVPLLADDDKIQLLLLCSFITTKHSNYSFGDSNLFFSNWHTNCSGAVKIFSNLSENNFKIEHIIVKLEKYDAECDAKTALKFFECCLLNRVITPKAYRDIISQYFFMKTAFTDKTSYGLFLSFLLENPQEAKDHLNKLSPEILYYNLSGLQDLIEKIHYQAIRDELNCILFEKFLANQDYSNATKQCFKSTSDSFVIPIKLLEKYYLELNMIIHDYDILKLKEQVLERLSEHLDKSSLSTYMALDKITDKEKACCAIRHIIKLLNMVKSKIEEKQKEEPARKSIYEFMGTIFGAKNTVDEQIIDACLNLAMDSVSKMESMEEVADVYVLLKDFYQIVKGKALQCIEKAIKQTFNDIENILKLVITDLDKAPKIQYT